jgi:hypothetical protein
VLNVRNYVSYSVQRNSPKKIRQYCKDSWMQSSMSFHNTCDLSMPKHDDTEYGNEEGDDYAFLLSIQYLTIYILYKRGWHKKVSICPPAVDYWFLSLHVMLNKYLIHDMYCLYLHQFRVFLIFHATTNFSLRFFSLQIMHVTCLIIDRLKSLQKYVFFEK